LTGVDITALLWFSERNLEKNQSAGDPAPTTIDCHDDLSFRSSPPMIANVCTFGQRKARISLEFLNGKRMRNTRKERRMNEIQSDDRKRNATANESEESESEPNE
jgi:hypothetical protein